MPTAAAPTAVPATATAAVGAAAAARVAVARATKGVEMAAQVAGGGKATVVATREAVAETGAARCGTRKADVVG